MAENTLTEENAQDKLENLFVQATGKFRIWLRSACIPEVLFKIFKEIMWSLQFATTSHSEAVIILWFDLMELMRTTHEHSVREWTYEVLVEFTSMRHLVEIVASNGGLRALQLEFYGLQSHPIVVSSGAGTIVETMLVRLSLCLSQRFPEFAAVILLDNKVAAMISKMIDNKALSRKFRQEVSKRYLKLCESVKKQLDGSRPPQHLRVNQLRNQHEYHHLLRQQQHQKYLQQQYQKCVQQPQQFPLDRMAPQAQAHDAQNPDPRVLQGEHSRALRERDMQMELKSQPALGRTICERNPQRAQQQHWQGQHQQTMLQYSRTSSEQQVQSSNPRDKILLEMYKDVMRERHEWEMQQALTRIWTFEPVPDKYLRESQQQTRRKRANGFDIERSALEQAYPLSDELDSVLRELDQIRLQGNDQQEPGSSGESQKREIEGFMKKIEPHQQELQVQRQRCDVEELSSFPKRPALGSKTAQLEGWIELPEGDFDSDQQENVIRDLSGLRLEGTVQSWIQEPPNEGQFSDRNSATTPELEEPIGESKLLKLLRAEPEPQGVWSRDVLQERDRISALQNDLQQKLRIQQKQHDRLLKVVALRSKSKREKLRVLEDSSLLHNQAVSRKGVFPAQEDFQGCPRRMEYQQQMFPNSWQIVKQLQMSHEAAAACSQQRSVLKPLQEWQLPCEAIIRLQMEDGSLNLPPEQAEKYRHRG